MRYIISYMLFIYNVPESFLAIVTKNKFNIILFKSKT